MGIKRKSIVVLTLMFTLLFSTVAVWAQEGMVFFKGTWEEVLAEAKKQDKPIVVDAYTAWCGPCKRMAKQTFTDPTVGAFYNKYYINYKVDAEKGEGPAFAEKYKVNRYPTLLYINPEGEMIHRAIGFRAPKPFIAEGRKGLFDEKKFKALEADYKSGKREVTMVRDYVQLLFLAEAKDYEEVANDFFSSLTPDQITTPDMLKTIFMLTNGITTKPFDLLMKNRSLFEETFGKDEVNKKIAEASMGSLKKAAETRDDKLFKKVQKTLKKSGHPKATTLMEQSALQYYEHTKNWKKYAKSVSKFVQNNGADIKDWKVYNHFSWRFYEHVDNKKYLQQAKEWSLKSIEMNSNYHNNDTYAAILYKLGDKSGAIVAAEKAISIAKMDKVKDYSATQKLLEKIIAE